MEVKAIVDCRTSLGEGPLWDVEEQRIYWIDSMGDKLFRAEPDGSGVEMWELPSHIGSLALRRGGGAILALRNGPHTFDFRTGRCELIAEPQPGLPTLRFNDGKVDRRGRFVFGSMDLEEKQRIGKLYRLEPDFSLHEIMDGILVTNGPCWSPDDKTFYFADSPTQDITAYDYDIETGTLSNRRIFAEFDKTSLAKGAPDGATVDAEGYLWSAAIFSGELRRFAPDGTLDHVLKLPLNNVTSLNFGGPNLDVIYCTSIADIHLPGLSNDGEGRGSLLAVYDSGFRGIEEPRFAG